MSKHNTDDLEQGFQELARWANATQRPKPPEYIPGLSSINKQLFEEYKSRLIVWKIGKAEALMYGLQNTTSQLVGAKTPTRTAL